jgi:hypothetical protein
MRWYASGRPSSLWRNITQLFEDNLNIQATARGLGDFGCALKYPVWLFRQTEHRLPRLTLLCRLVMPIVEFICRCSSLIEKDFERFSVYGFSVDYPQDSRVEFNPKGRRGEGDVVFHLPDRTKFFLSWGNLERASKSFKTVEEQAENSLKQIGKAGNVKSFERVSHDSITIHSHNGAYNQARFEEVTLGFVGKKKYPREAHSVHVHCPETGRYYVIYAMLPEGGTYDYQGAFRMMAKSLHCH